MALTDPNDFTVRPDIQKRAKEKRNERRIGRAIVTLSLVALILFSSVVIYTVINQGDGEAITIDAQQDIRVPPPDAVGSGDDAPPGSEIYVITQGDADTQDGDRPSQDILADQNGNTATGGNNSTQSGTRAGSATAGNVPEPEVITTPLPRAGEVGSTVPAGWYAQLGSYSRQGNALKAMANIAGHTDAAALGDNPLQVYTLVLKNGKTVHRVVAGPGSNSTLIKDLCRQVKASQLADCIVIRVTP